MRNPPPEVVATWPKPNYVDPEHRGDELLIAETAVLAIALFCLALRLYVRVVIVSKSGLDDWYMVIAAVSSRRLLVLFLGGGGSGVEYT